MPVVTEIPIVVFDQEAFHDIDRVVTGLAFDIHNEMGRYLEELIYQAEMLARMQDRSLLAVREMMITVVLGEFRKIYRLDFLVNQGVIVETKTAKCLTTSHTAQVLNYLFLCGLQHGTLLNFRTERVQHEFVSTHLTLTDRRQIIWSCKNWEFLTPACHVLRNTLTEAMADWGACLDPNLYRELIVHRLGGDDKVLWGEEICSTSGSVGLQKVHHLSDEIAFSITASLHHPETVHEHLRRFLQHTKLRAIQWINLNRMNISMTTIHRES